ncbi:phosphatase PAP2 family protein [Porphyromonas loveana]|uniref:phosphatase PAP2 family protein n=1 Tax=Porphyromonas loveana TaxID=1884669 RepID=UPI0035A10BF5
MFLEHLLVVERELFLALNGIHHPFLDAFFFLISAKWPWVIMAVVFLFFLFYKKPPKEAAFILGAVLLSVLICDQLSSSFFKPVFTRFRPTHHPEFMDYVKTVYGYRGGKYGFISGHTINYVSLAVLTSLIFRNKLYTWIISGVTVLVMYSRIYLGVHFITDIIPALVFGLLIGYLVYRAYIWARAKWMKPPFPADPAAVYAGVSIRLWTYSLIGFVVALLISSRQMMEILHHYVFLNF